MKTEDQRLAACAGKQRYPSFEAARQWTLVKKKRTHGKTTTGLRPYHCTFCGGFHVGR